MKEEEKHSFQTQNNKTTSLVVSFASTVLFRETLNIGDYSDVEKLAYWYNKKELLSIKREAKKCSVEFLSSSSSLAMALMVVTEQKDEGKDNDNESTRPRMITSTGTTTDTTTTVAAIAASSSSIDAKFGFSDKATLSLLMRGLESFTPNGYATRKRNRNKAWTVVFDEQYLQEEKEEEEDDEESPNFIYDFETIALLYLEKTKQCREEALQLGRQDEAWVLLEQQQQQKQ